MTFAWLLLHGLSLAGLLALARFDVRREPPDDGGT